MKKLTSLILQIRSRFRKERQTLIKIEIDSKKILENFKSFKLKTNSDIYPVLKSNAYGHGIVGIAKILENSDEKPKKMIVDSLFEAEQLRANGIKTDLLVIGYTSPCEISKFIKNITFTITSIEHLENILKNIQADFLNKISFNLKVDTGMNRQGIRHDDIEKAIEILENNSLNIVSVCTHLANPLGDENFTKKQLDLFENVVTKFKKTKKLSQTVTDYHALASEGALFGLANKTDTLSHYIKGPIRLGIGLYLGPELSNPALSLKSIISSTKKVPAGEKIGYNGTFVADRDMIIATVPAGYYEGIDRRLSNKGVFSVMQNGKKYFTPIVGRVSMNITTIDISGVPDVKIGDEIVLISNNTSDDNSVKRIAEICETIPYEILVHIPQHLKRVYF